MELDQIMLLVNARQRARSGSAREIRRRAGLTMSEMAKAVGVVESAISRWENGSRQPRGEAALRWAAILTELEKTSMPASATYP